MNLTQTAVMSDCAKGIDCTEASSWDCPGKVDQKKPRQSGSSKMYGNTRVSNRTQFRTEHKKQLQSCTTTPKSAVIHSSELNKQNNYKDEPQYSSWQSYTVQNWTHKIITKLYHNTWVSSHTQFTTELTK
jgi:hypothetical protein